MTSWQQPIVRNASAKLSPTSSRVQLLPLELTQTRNRRFFNMCFFNLRNNFQLFRLMLMIIKKLFPGKWRHTSPQFKGPASAILLPHEYSCPYEYLPFRRPPGLCGAGLICCAESGNGGTQPRRLTPHSLFTSWLCCDAKCSME